MNTAKKRILSLTLTICLALSMMLTLSACGKKNLEEYFNTDTMQKLVTSSIEQYESQGMELKMYAEGDELHYDLTLTTIETTDDDRSVYAEALEAGLAETAQTFVDAAKDVQKSVSNETVLVVVTYFDAAGVELAGSCRKIVCPPQHSANFGGGKFHAEGLGDEIISAHAQCHHLVHLVRGGGEEYNGHPADLPDLGAPVIAAEIGKGDVHQHQIRLCLLKFLHDMVKLLHIGRLVVPAGQLAGQ